ncbi:MAG: ABC transporter permease [Thermoplasmatota archaeon]
MNEVLLRMTLAQTVRSKRALIALIVSVLPFVFGLAAVLENNSNTWSPFLDELLFICFGFTIPLVALILIGGLIADEVEDRTISYLLTAPIYRADLFRSRALAIAILVAGFALIQGLGVYFVELVHYMSSDQGELYTRGGDASATRVLGAGFFMAMLLPAMVAIGYTFLFGFLSLAIGKWHFLAAVAATGLDLATVFSDNIFLGSASAAGALFDAVVGFGTGSRGAVGMLFLLALPAVWYVLGVFVVKRKEFHVTSAVT